MQRGLGVSVACMAARCTCDVHRNVHANVHGERNQGSRAKLAGDASPTDVPAQRTTDVA